MRQAIDFTGRTILVTGATRGIGREITRLLIQRGAKRVLAVARDGDALRQIEEAYPGHVAVKAVDLGAEGATVDLASWVASEHPDCSILINNAAVMYHSDLTTKDQRPDLIAREIAVNLRAPIELSVALLPILAANKSAVIANVTSGLAIAPKAGAAVYCATKSGLRTFTRALRYQCEHARLNMQISEVIMTLVDTSLSSSSPIRKYPPARAAQDLLNGIELGKNEIWVEKTRLLRIVHRIAPSLAYRLMRNR
ncbi:MAG TPA: SDR family NAD(P)-dependent oxidoreductase [Ramlibacter sp.]